MKVRHSDQWQDADVLVRQDGEWKPATPWCRYGGRWTKSLVTTEHILTVEKSPQNIYGLISDVNGRYGSINPNQHKGLDGLINGLGYRSNDYKTFFNLNVATTNAGKKVVIKTADYSLSFFISSSGWTDIANGDVFNIQSNQDKDMLFEIIV